MVIFFKNIEIVYDPIDTEVFYEGTEEKKYDIVYCGYLHALKGVRRLVEYATANPHRSIDIFGWYLPRNISKHV